MSLEAQISRLADAVEQLVTLTAERTPPAQAIPTEVPTAAEPDTTETPTRAAEPEAPVTTGDDDAPPAGDEDGEVVWYHDPEKQQVWTETGPAKRRRGIYKVDEATARKLQGKYGEDAGGGEAEPAADPGPTGEHEGGKYDESQPMGDDAWGEAWKEWGAMAMRHALDNGAPDNKAAELQIKKFVLPLVKELTDPGEEPRLANLSPEARPRFLNKACDFFNH